MLPAGVKVDVTKVRYVVVKSALEKIGCEQTKEDPTAVIVWWDGFISCQRFQTILPHQRINKIPAMDVMCYKNTFFQALAHMKSLFPTFYCFFATTFQLPAQFSEFKREHERLCGRGSTLTWILKPQNGCCGHGIRLVQSPFDVSTYAHQAIIQRYVSPFLIDGYKFDFRLYILISTLKPFTVYVYEEGLCRYCSEKYVAPTAENLEDKFAHLSNTSVNVGNKERTRPILELASDAMQKIKDLDQRGKTLWARIRQVVLLAVIAQYPNILRNVAIYTPPIRPTEGRPPGIPIGEMQKYFHILGIDIMLNTRCEPVVLELNDRPSMVVTYELERALKSGLVFDALNIITPDGRPSDANARPGGWQKLFPAEDNMPFGKAVSTMLLKSCQSPTEAEKPSKKTGITRLGYTPKSTSRTKGRSPALPPLRQ